MNQQLTASEIGAVAPNKDHVILENGQELGITATFAAHLTSVGLIYKQSDDPSNLLYHIVDPHSWPEIDAAITALEARKLLDGDDFVTHRAAWRDALVIARDFGLVLSIESIELGLSTDTDDEVNWDREIGTYDGALSACASDEITDDLEKHRSVWRYALEHARDRSVDGDHKAYWVHELAAFDRAFEAVGVQRKLPERPVSLVLHVPVTTNAAVTPEQIRATVQRLIDAGLADATETLESGEGDIAGAQLATDLNIGAPTVAKVNLRGEVDSTAGNLANGVAVKNMSAFEAAQTLAKLASRITGPVGLGIWEGTLTGAISGNAHSAEHIAVFRESDLIAPFGPRGDAESEACAALFALALASAATIAAALSRQ